MDSGPGGEEGLENRKRLKIEKKTKNENIRNQNTNFGFYWFWTKILFFFGFLNFPVSRGSWGQDAPIFCFCFYFSLYSVFQGSNT